MKVKAFSHFSSYPFTNVQFFCFCQCPDLILFIQPLPLNQLGKIAVQSDQLIIVSFLDDLAAVKDEYAVTVAYCRKSVSYDDTGAAHFVKSLADLLLCLVVKR